MSGVQTLEVVYCEGTSRGVLPRSRHVRLLHSFKPTSVERLHNLFVLCSYVDLPDVAELVSVANKHHRLRALFLHTPTADPFLPQMMDRAGLRILRNTLVHSDWTVPRRVLHAWVLGAQADLIANATIAGDSVFVVSCEPNTLEVPFDSVPALRRLPLSERPKFTIANDGSYLHWEKSDVHLDLDALKSAVIPEWRSRRLAQRLRHDRRYGVAIARLRRSRGLLQKDIRGLSARHVRRLEQGAPPSVSALRHLAVAHRMTLDEYADSLAALVPGGQR